jgi:hypothetical protein
MNHEVVSGIINSLPIEKMIAAPLTAAIQAQSQMSMAMAQFIDTVGITKDGEIRMVTFKYDEMMQDPANPANTKSETRYIQAPFLAMTGIPNLAVESVNIDFELEVKTAETDVSKSQSEFKNETEAKWSSWWSPGSASTKFTGSVSNSRETTRHTDTRAKYSFNVSARKQPAPEAFMRIVDAITNGVAKPTEQEKKSNLLGEIEGGEKKKKDEGK